METTHTILIIDDDRAQLLALRTFLESLGLRVVEASSGEEGLTLFRRELPDLVLLDITMPGMNGFEACERLKALPGAEVTPVIVMSGLLGTRQKLQAFHSGAVDCLPKPLQLEEVEARVRTHLAIQFQNAQLMRSRDSLQKALHDADAMNRNLIDLNHKLSRSEEVKTRFLALMRNEIYNPLSDIMGLSDRIAEGHLEPGKIQELASLVKAEAFALDCQIRNVFCAAELEAGEANPYIAKVDVESVLRDALESFAASAWSKGLELDAKVQGEVLGFPTDGEKLHLILVNILANAVHHSPAGARVVIRLEAGDSLLTLRITDQGPGIAPQAMAALFEPFQNDDGMFKVRRGQGLGLPVAKALLDILDGCLQVESEPGKGSTFRVSLPRATLSDERVVEAVDGNMLFFEEPQEF